MSKMRILIVLLLALALSMPAAGASLGVDMFNFPTLSVPSYNGESLLAQSYSSGATPIMAPTMGTILEGSTDGPTHPSCAFGVDLDKQHENIADKPATDAHEFQGK